MPNIVRNSLINTFEMIGYDQTKELVATYTNLDSEAPHMYLFYGLVSGIVAGFLVNPIDVVKTNMMAEGPKYGGSNFKCIAHIFKTKGFLGFYKGLVPMMWRLSAFCVTMFGMIGYIRAFLNSKI